MEKKNGRQWDYIGARSTNKSTRSRPRMRLLAALAAVSFSCTCTPSYSFSPVPTSAGTSLRACPTRSCVIPPHHQQHSVYVRGRVAPSPFGLGMASSATAATASPRRSPKEEKKKERMKRRPGPSAQRSEMMNHGILTREQDFDLGEKIQRANQLKQTIVGYLEQQAVTDAQHFNFDDEGESLQESLLYTSGTIRQDSDLEEDLHNLSVYSESTGYTHMNMNMQSYDIDRSYMDQNDDATTTVLPPIPEDILFHLDHSQNRRQLSVSPHRVVDDDFESLSQLTEEDIVRGLKLLGGRSELQTILVQGALARNTLISSNIRLVNSIAKKWSRNFDGVGGNNKLSQLYAGSSTRPSLDEVVQEGIVGLAKAADRYDPSRKLRFSTYATFYITNQVRIAFQQASTNGLRVPAPYHDIKARYKRILRQCLESNTPVPSEEDMAEQVGVTLSRLRKALMYTQPCISLDAPLTENGGGASRGSSAGEGGGDREVPLSEMMECQDEKNHPEQQVELSLLRQCLETAMACELSPHERDVVRLRLGLDDGVSRTARQVVEVLGGSCSIPDVRNAEKRAYSKLSSPFAVHTRQLLSYFDFCGCDLETIR